MESDQIERLTLAIEGMGSAFRDIGASLYLLQQVARDLYNKQYPVRGKVDDATITHVQTEEERLRESQGYSEEDDEAWLGRRERAFEDSKA